MTTSTPDTHPSMRTVAERPAGLRWWHAAAAGAVAATLINLAILAIARAADASLILRQPAGDHAITVGGVIFSSVVPMTAGIVLATLLSRWWAGFLRLAQLIGGGFALLSMAGPLTSDTDSGTGVALALMHLVVGVLVVLALEAIRRRRAAAA